MRLNHGENFRFVCVLKLKLQSFKFIELDVCGRPLFVNPVTYVILAGDLNIDLLQQSKHHAGYIDWVNDFHLKKFLTTHQSAKDVVF